MKISMPDENYVEKFSFRKKFEHYIQFESHFIMVKKKHHYIQFFKKCLV